MIDYAKELSSLHAAGAFRTLPAPPERPMVNLSSNDYMGLGDNADLWHEFLGQYSPKTSSMSASSSRLLTGNHCEHAMLEQTLTDLYGGRPALVFNCGYHANTGILPALADRGDLVVADKLIHASLIDGMRLCAAAGARTARFNHNDMGHLRRLLESHGGGRRTFVVVESIYSMDGDMAPLREIAELRRRFGFLLYVDEAHGVGARGPGGAGVAAEMGLTGDVDILVGTCGKALASTGAWAVTTETVRQWLVNKCRTLIFTTALPPICAAWTDFAIRKLEGMDAERRHLAELGRWLTRRLGQDETRGDATHIVPYMCGENAAALRLSQRLRDSGFLTMPIRHPTVPQGQARLRLSLKANMERETLEPLTVAIDQYRQDEAQADS